LVIQICDIALAGTLWLLDSRLRGNDGLRCWNSGKRCGNDRYGSARKKYKKSASSPRLINAISYIFDKSKTATAVD
jgi:hypothetical protein